MAIEARLSLRQSQRLVMTPLLQQAVGTGAVSMQVDVVGRAQY